MILLTDTATLEMPPCRRMPRGTGGRLVSLSEFRVVLDLDFILRPPIEKFAVRYTLAHQFIAKTCGDSNSPTVAYD